MSGQREDDLDVVIAQQRAEPSLHAEDQHIDKARYHGRYRKRQVDQGHKKALAGKVELRHGPGGGDAEHHIERHGDGGHQESQANGRARVGIVEGRERLAEAAAQRLLEHGDEREEEEQHNEPNRDQDESRPRERSVLNGAAHAAS